MHLARFNLYLWLFVLFIAVSPLPSFADSTVVFNEIMYHPATNEAQLEWVELHNQMAVDMDISGWSLTNGVNYTFPEGTIFPGGGYLVVAIDPTFLMSTTGATNVLGPFSGRLSNSGETLELLNNNQRVMDTVTYGVDGDWPVGANGLGASLAKFDEEMAGDQATNWHASAQNGGTPGAPNYPPRVTTFVTNNAVALDSTWRYDGSGVDRGTAWTASGYDDSAWKSGAGTFYAGTTPPTQSAPIATLFNSGVGTNGTVLASASADPHYVLTSSAYSTPPPPALAATVMVNHPNWLANDTQSMWIGAISQGATSVPAGLYVYRTTFDLTGYVASSAKVNLQIAADNEVTNTLLNGVATKARFSNFNAFSTNFVLTNGFVAGTNTLDFSVLNIGTTASPSGFRALASGTAQKLTPTNTALTLGPNTFYFRKSFMFSGNPENTAIQLRSTVDDGAVFYLNGTEIYRQNMPAGQISFTTFASTNVTSNTFNGPLILPGSALLSGTNELAVEVHQAAGGANDILFGAEFVLQTSNGPPPLPPKLALNEMPAVTNGQFWVEIFNFGTTNESLGGLTLERVGSSDTKQFVLPQQVLPPGGWVVLDKTLVGFGADPGDQVALISASGNAVIDAVIAQNYDQARYPEGIGPWLHPNVLTPGASNSFAFHNEIVINEIMYHARDLTNGQSSPESWVELFNRSPTNVDLTGWQLAGDIGFTFPSNTIMASGGYLVVAKDAAYMNGIRPGVNALGNFSGKLSKSSSVIQILDAVGNPENRVQYYDTLPWPIYADGNGSSLELRDPWADNSRPEAWVASDESANSSWQTYSYSGTNTPEIASSPASTVWKEFDFGLLGAGDVLLDDFSVIESPGGANKQLLQNGSFENGSNSWRFLGTQRQAQVIVDPTNPANHVLWLHATSDTEHMHNHVETTFINNLPITNGLVYQISFRAKWLGGCNRLNTRLYFNCLANTTNLAVPQLGGTPGARNSGFVSDMGPTFSGLQHSPVVPLSNNVVTVTGIATDSHNITSATLFYSVNGGAWKSNTVSITPGPIVNLQSTIPAQASLSEVQFYFSATDGLGVTTFGPVGGTNSRAMFAVGGQPLLLRTHTVRILMTPSDIAYFLAPTNVMSNERIGCTLIMDESRVFYDTAIHLQGSERGRNVPLRRGFSFELPAGQLYRGAQPHLTIDPSGGYSGLGGKQDEMLLKHLVNKAGGLPGMYDDLVQFFAPTAAENGTGLLLMARYDDIFLDSQYPDGSDGEMYKLELIYYPTTTVVATDPQSWKLPTPDTVLGTDLKNLGDSQEGYRWNLLKENHVSQDNYAPLIPLMKAFDLTGATLNTQMQQLMDVDEWMRAVAFISLIGGTDIYTYGNSHNFEVYIRPSDNKAMAFLWDMDNSFTAATTQSIPGTANANTYKLITTIPNNLRRYYWHLMDLTSLTGNTNYTGDWATRYASMVGQNWGGAVNYLAQRATYVRSLLPLTGPFAITNNNGNNFTVANSPVSLAGLAPLTVKDISVNGTIYPVTWLSLSNWSVIVPLTSVTNVLNVLGVDKNGAPVPNASASITVTDGGLLAPVPVVVNEWMANNGGPNGFPDPLDGKFSDWFELYNPNYAPADISGFYLTDTLSKPTKWTIPTNTIIPARGFLLVWADGNTDLNGPAANGDLHASFSLSESGEAIGLYATNLAPQHTVTFGLQTQNVSQGLYPDGNTNNIVFMNNWSPHQPNQLGNAPGSTITAPTISTNGIVIFNLSSFTGHNYRIDYKNALTDPAWIPLQTNRAVSPTLTISDTTTNRPQRFYRAVMMP